MAEVTRIYRQSVPALRFIGKQYADEDRGPDGGFGRQWDEWWANGWFDELDARCGGAPGFEDGAATIGLMRWKEGDPFQYWIGKFYAPGAQPPEGFARVDFEAADLGVGWLRGKMDDLFGQEHLCAAGCQEAGYQIVMDDEDAFWFFERYACPRFTQPDEQGRITLDICHFIAKE